MEVGVITCSEVAKDEPEKMQSTTITTVECPNDYLNNEGNVVATLQAQDDDNSVAKSETIQDGIVLSAREPLALATPLPSLSTTSADDGGRKQGIGNDTSKEEAKSSTVNSEMEVNLGNCKALCPPSFPLPGASGEEEARNNTREAMPLMMQTTTVSQEIKSPKTRRSSSSSSSLLSSSFVPSPAVAGTSTSFNQVATIDGTKYRTTQSVRPWPASRPEPSRGVRKQQVSNSNIKSQTDAEKLALKLKQRKHEHQIEDFKMKLERLENLNDLNTKYVRKTRLVTGDLTIVVLKSKDPVFADNGKEIKRRKEVDVRFLDREILMDWSKIFYISNQVWVRKIENNSALKICRHRKKPLKSFLFEQFGIEVCSVKAMCFADNIETSYKKHDGKWISNDIEKLERVCNTCKEGETVFLCSLSLQHKEQVGLMLLLKIAFDGVLIVRNKNNGIEGIFAIKFLGKSKVLSDTLLNWKQSLKNNGVGPDLLLDRLELEKCVVLEKLTEYNSGLAANVLRSLVSSVLLRCNHETRNIMKELEE